MDPAVAASEHFSSKWPLLMELSASNLGAVKSALATSATSSAPSVTTGTTQEDSTVNPATMDEAIKGSPTHRPLQRRFPMGPCFGPVLWVMRSLWLRDLAGAQSGSVDQRLWLQCVSFRRMIDGRWCLGAGNLTALMKNTTEKRLITK